jgi:hypothetical protein
MPEPARYGRWWKGTPDEATPSTLQRTGKLSTATLGNFALGDMTPEAVVEKVRIMQLGPRQMQRARAVLSRVAKTATQKGVSQLEALSIVLGLDREAAVVLHDLAVRIAPSLNVPISEALAQLIATGFPYVTR